MVVGLVLVSHSAALAGGAAELAGQLTAGRVPVVAAGGTGDGRLGTDPELIAAAIAAADRGQGVLLIPDLGSAVLTTRTVLDDREPDAARAVLVDAPFVEGAVAAAAAAAAGLDLDQVADAAREAREIPKF
jgi:phosphoenolpyruvate---glycerone phosphotransferase subunit DhaM